MNIYLITANVLLVITFLVHTYLGDRELKVIMPDTQTNGFKPQEVWTMARGGFHWVSIDLLLATITLSLVNFTDYIPNPSLVLNLMAAYFAVNAIIWLLVVLLSPSFPQKLFKLGQWLLLLVMAGLIYLGNG